MNINNQDEPIRKNVYLAALVVAASTLFGTLALVDNVTAQVVFGALAAAFGQFALLAFGAEQARHKAWAPSSVKTKLDEVELAVQEGPPEEFDRYKDVLPDELITAPELGGITHPDYPDVKFDG